LAANRSSKVENVRIPAPDFTEDELRDIHAILQQRYGAEVAVDLADSELMLDPLQDAKTECPTVYWRARGAQLLRLVLAQVAHVPDSRLGSDPAFRERS
jgi:hypothetical protein